MKIATNVTRDYLGGITRSNVSFLDSIHGKMPGVIGIELNNRRSVKSPTIFRHLSPDWFDHFVVNIHDLNLFKMIQSSKNIKDLEKKYRPIIKIVKEIFKREKPDVVFLNGTYFIPWIISIAAHELKIPIVLRYAGVYSKETENHKPKEKKFFNLIEKSFQKRAKHFIFPSNLCKKMVEDDVLNKKVKNSYIIPNPFNIPDNNHILRTTERKIAAVGRWDKIKNFSRYFDIHKQLLKENWYHEASFVTGDAKIKSFPKTINRFGSMTYSELNRFYTAQGLIICPSIFETFGNVPIEAVCNGVPVLVSENMGCSEVLRLAGLESMIISFDDLKKVTERVKKLCGQQILPKQINNLRKILDPDVINAEIMSVLRTAARLK